jgi:hypothetical protein
VLFGVLVTQNLAFFAMLFVFEWFFCLGRDVDCCFFLFCLDTHLPLMGLKEQKSQAIEQKIRLLVNIDSPQQKFLFNSVFKKLHSHFVCSVISKLVFQFLAKPMCISLCYQKSPTK